VVFFKVSLTSSPP